MRITIEPGVRLFVDVEGPGLVPDGAQMREKPTLIVMHGGPGYDHSSFKPLFSRLADVAQIVYYDHRGHGRSDRRPAAEWTLDTFADDIVRLCDALGIVKPIVLGQSFGGFVAQRYLARHPAHAAKVVLSSTSHHLGLERKVAAFTRFGGPEAGAAARAFWTAPGPATWGRYNQHCRHVYNPTPADPVARGRTLMNEDILFTSASGEQQTMKLLPGLAQVQCPVLVMAGELDPVTPLADAQEIAAAIPAPWGRLVTFPRAGHGAWRDQPDEAMAVLREFIDTAA
ncbi:MAG: alpha/beta hydrolase [Leptothrix sp. (in: Bacteria)]|nr:alpha/beta hydrolase [Leptothrix sp. (in: b-proteobacteria)]